MRIFFSPFLILVKSLIIKYLVTNTSSVKNRFGISPVEYAELQVKKAICLSILRKYDDATKSHKKSIIIFIDKYGPNHVSVLNGLFNIGVCLKDKGDTNKAIAYLEKALQLTVKVFGKNHINVSDTLFHLGLALKDVRDFDKSKSIFEDSLELLKETKNYENERSLYILEQLGDIVSHFIVKRMHNIDLICKCNY